MAGRAGAGRYSGKLFEEAVRRAACAQIRAGDQKGWRKLDAIALRLVDKAVDGDLEAMKTVAERLKGATTILRNLAHLAQPAKAA